MTNTPDTAAPVARLRAVWTVDPDILADFALMPDGRILRRFDDATAWTRQGTADPAGGVAALREWMEPRDYRPVPAAVPALAESSKRLLLQQAVALFGNCQHAEREFLEAKESLRRALGSLPEELGGEYTEITERMRAEQDERDEKQRQRRLAARRAAAITADSPADLGPEGERLAREEREN